MPKTKKAVQKPAERAHAEAVQEVEEIERLRGAHAGTVGVDQVEYAQQRPRAAPPTISTQWEVERDAEGLNVQGRGADADLQP